MTEEKKGTTEKGKEPGVAVKPHDVFREALFARKDEFEAALAGRMDVGHFMEVAMTAYLANPDLAKKCTPISLFGALRRAAQLKLRPDGEEAAIIPYKGEAQFQPMFRGIVRTMLRTRTVRKVEAHVVRTGDEFEYELGLDPKLRHVPAQSDRRGETTYVYAIVWLTNGDRQFEVMDRAALDDIEKEAARQRAGNSTPAWRNHPDEMRRKIAVKRLAKYCEMDPEQAAVLRYDDAMDTGKDVEPGDLIPEAEWRTVDQRAQDHAKRQTDELRKSMERMAGNGDDIETISGGIEEAEVIPDPEELEALRTRGSAAITALRKAKAITDEEMAERGADLGLLHDEGNYHALADYVDALEREAGAATGDLFGGGA